MSFKTTANMRYPLLDVVRGVAVLAMMAYHFGFDLNMNGYLAQDINNSMAWLTARSFILGTFLFVSGFSLALATTSPTNKRLTRIARIAICAALVSLGTYFMFPQSWVFFGVLHFVAVASLICWPLQTRPQLLLPLGFVVLALGLGYTSPVFDQPMQQWIGMMTHKPITEDYVPLFPWLGVVLLGLFAGNKAITKGWMSRLASTTQPAPNNPIGWLGRHSLVVYMLHQPLLLGLLLAYGAMFK